MFYLRTKKAPLRLFYPLIYFLLSYFNLALADSGWSSWFDQQIAQNPEIKAAQQRLNRQNTLADGREKPLYNPALETELEREGSDNNFRIGISQTVDWWDKKSIRKAESIQSRVSAKQQFTLLYQAKVYQALQALVAWQTVKQQAALAITQEKQLNRLVALVKQRQRAGDLSLLDAELSILGLSEKFSVTATIEVALKQAENQVLEQLPAWTANAPEANIPDDFWQLKPNQKAVEEDLLNQHPALMRAKADWLKSKKSLLLSQREAKADPTFGINAGRVGSDNALTLNFSIPLNIRNNFSEQIKAAQQQILVAEETYHALYRQQKFAILSSQQTLMLYQSHLKRWQKLMKGRSSRFSQLLKKQWRSGDLTTSEYLLALQQQTAALNAGIALKQQTQLAYLNWQYQRGQINAGIK